MRSHEQGQCGLQVLLSSFGPSGLQPLREVARYGIVLSEMLKKLSSLWCSDSTPFQEWSNTVPQWTVGQVPLLYMQCPFVGHEDPELWGIHDQIESNLGFGNCLKWFRPHFILLHNPFTKFNKSTHQKRLENLPPLQLLVTEPVGQSRAQACEDAFKIILGQTDLCTIAVFCAPMIVLLLSCVCNTRSTLAWALSGWRAARPLPYVPASFSIKQVGKIIF